MKNFALTAALSFASTASAATTFFVNGVSGSDSNAGTSSTAAFATVAKGLDAIAGVKRPLESAITLTISGGVYHQGKPLKMTAKHSGDEENAVTIIGTDGSVRITGAAAVNASQIARPATAEDYAAYFTERFPAEYAALDAAAAATATKPAAGALIIDLKAAGITEYGKWSVQGGYEYGCTGAAMELFVGGAWRKNTFFSSFPIITGFSTLLT